MLRRIGFWALIAFIVYYVATDPSGAGGLITSALSGLRSAGHAGTDFLNSLHL